MAGTTTADTESEKPTNSESETASESEEDSAVKEELNSYVQGYINALRPFLLFAKIFSRFPIQLTKAKTKDETYVFSYQPRSVPAIVFIALQIFIAIISIIISCNCMGLLMNFPRQRKGGVTSSDPQTTRAEELYIFKRNLAPLVIFFSCLFHINVANWNFFLRKKFVASYFNFWPEALKTLRFDAAQGVSKTISWIIGSYTCFLVLLIIFVVVRISPVTSGFPGLVSMLLLRTFNPASHASNLHVVFRYLAAVFILYIFIASKIFPILFILKAKLLRNAFALWNRRLDIILNKSSTYFPKEVAEAMTDRISFPDLFRGHILLLDLLEGNDELFSETIESYLGSQITSLVFEFYYFYRAQRASDEFGRERSLDVIVIGLYLTHSLIFLCFVVFSANAVNVEAMDGLEIIRRKGFIGKRSNDELYFLLSMYISYTGHFETAVNAAGYFVYNKTYFIVIFGVIATYVVIFFQFSPQLELTDANIRPLILDEQRLLKFVEDTADVIENRQVGAFLMDFFYLNTTFPNSSLIGSTTFSYNNSNGNGIWYF